MQEPAGVVGVSLPADLCKQSAPSADPMRHHIKFARLFEVARILAHMRDDYKEIVLYMRGYSAH